MNPTVLKGTGYIVSILSVSLLGTVAWKNASQDPLMLALLVAGMATSVIGMFLRWMSYWEQQEEEGG